MTNKNKKNILSIGILLVVLGSFMFAGQASANAKCACKVEYKIINMPKANIESSCKALSGSFGKGKDTTGTCTIKSLTVAASNDADCSVTAKISPNVKQKIITAQTGTGYKLTINNQSCKSATVKYGTSEDACGSAYTTKQLVKCAGKQLNPANINKPSQLIGYAIKFNFALIGGISMVLYIWAGFLFMTARGNADQRGKAIKIIVWVTLGVLAMFASYMVISYVFEQLIV